MGYTKAIISGNQFEFYSYEKDLITYREKRRRNKIESPVLDFPASGKAVYDSEKQDTSRELSSRRRASLGFRRLVLANLVRVGHPLFVSLTYSDDTHDIHKARHDFNTYERRIRKHFGNEVVTISVTEFQKRGVIHFHALHWGIPFAYAESERETRLFAGFWSRGFADVVGTDGNEKIAGYMAKYMSKSFNDPRLKNKKAYVCSRNALRPVVDRGAIYLSYYHGFNGVNLSTYELLQINEFDTQWLGRCHYQRLNKRVL